MPGREQGEREQLGNEIAALISGVARRYRGSFVGCADQLGLGAGEAQALWLLSSGGDATTGELARRLSIDPANASTLLSKLERRGLIRRKTASHDRRKRIVSLTAKGRQTDHALALCMQRSPAGFGELATSELVTFRDLLRRVAGEG
jgi:MarR family transcriptional regulator, organic hydroperoxide resistance regulator